MDKETVLYLITIGSFLFGFSSFLFSRKKESTTTASELAKWQGGVDAKLDQVLINVSVIPSLSTQLTANEESTKSAHKRIDNLEKHILK